MKRVMKILAVLLLILAVAVLMRDGLVKTGLQVGTKVLTGLDLKVTRFHIGLQSGSIQITGLRLENPSEFEERTMLSIPDVYVDYAPFTFLKGKFRFDDVRVYLEEFNLVKHSDGTLNIDTFKKFIPAKSEEQAPEPQAPAGKTKPMQISVGRLALRIDQVSYKDYSVNPPKIQSFKVGINEEFSELPNVRAIIKLIFAKALGTSIGSLANLDLGQLQSSVSGIAGSTKDQALSRMQDLESAAESQAGAAVAKAADAMKGLTGKFKNPFGGSSAEETPEASAAEQTAR